MLVYRCDQCRTDIGEIRITLTGTSSERHFCTATCLLAQTGEALAAHPAPSEPCAKPDTPQVTGCAPTPEPPADLIDGKPRQRKAIRRTCATCGHQGYRRFVLTNTGAWQCWKCAPPSDIPAKQFRPNVTPAEPAEPKPAPRVPDWLNTPPEPSPALRRRPVSTSGVTAKCQDCTRTWVLTGRVLDQAVEMHELKHSHIVNVLEDVDA